MKVVTCITLLFLLGFIQESFQYGTIFTDNITPAFEDSTYFEGIKTEQAFSTDAEVGLIQSSNLLGFTINSPGGITSTSDTYSITGSHDVQLGNLENTQLNFHSNGDFTTTSQRTDIDGQTIQFSGTGDVFIGGLDSTVRANEFLFNSLSTVSLTATGDVLRVSAPVAVAFDLSKDANFIAERNIQVTSETSSISFLIQDDFDIQANHIDLDGSTGLTFDIDHDIHFAAASIIEFLPVGNFEANVDDFDVTVSSGDIQLIASSRIHFSGNTTQTSVFMTAQDNAFFTLKSTSEATMAVLCGDDITIRATEQITFASLMDQSDLTLAAVDRINQTAPVINLTTLKGTALAGGTLSIVSSDYLLVEVLGEDLTATAINGPVTFTAAGNFSLATNGDYVGEASNVYQKTNNDIRVFAQNILYKQDNVDSSGVITVNVETDIEVDATTTVFASAGDHFWNVAGDAVVNATNGIFIFADKSYVNDLVYSVNGNLSFVTKDLISYETSVLNFDGTDYNALTTDDYRVHTQGSLRQVISGGPFAGISEDINFEATEGDITFRILGDASLVSVAGDFTHWAYTHEFEADNINYQSEDIRVEVWTHLAAEVSGNAFWTTNQFEIDAIGTTQLSSDSFSLVTSGLVLDVDQAIQLSQNFPGDTLTMTTNLFTARGPTIDILSGGDLNWSSDLVTIDGPTSTYVADTTLEIRTSAYDISATSVNVISGGGLLFSASSINANSNGDFTIVGPQGQFGLTSFRAGDTTITAGSNGAGLFDVDADAISFNSNTFVNTNTGATLFSPPSPRVQDAAPSRFYGNTLNINAGSLTGTSNFVNLHAASISQSARNYLLSVQDTLKISTPASFITDFADFTLQAPTVTWKGEDLILSAEGSGTFTADFDNNGKGDFEGYSGLDYLYNVRNRLSITAPILTVNSADLLSIISKTNVNLGMSETISMRSGGKTLWDIAGDITYTAPHSSYTQAFYSKITTGADISFTADVGSTLLQANDGFAKFLANDFATLNSGTTTQFQAGNDIISYSQVSYTASADSGKSSVLTPTVGFYAQSQIADGNIVFDALQGQITASFLDTLVDRTNSYTDVVGATGVSWTAVTDIDVNVFKDFNISSIANTKFTTVGDFTHQVAKYAYFQSENAYVLDADANFLLTAGKGLLVTTGEQGALEWTSSHDIHVATTSFQHWRSSDSFTIVSQNNGVEFQSLQTDISLQTAGGQLLLDSNSGGTYDDVAAQNMLWFSGDYTKIQSGTDQAWTAGTQVRSLAKGDIFFDGNRAGSAAPSGTFRFTAQNNQQTWNADGTRFDEDAIELSAPVLTQTAALTANFNPVLSLLFGGETRPSLTWNAGGSSAQAGYILESDGNIYLQSVEGEYDATANYYLNTFKNTKVSSDNLLDLTATGGAVTLLADAGNLKFFAKSLTSTAATTYSVTATSGVFEILSSSSTLGANVGFEADSTITTNANTFSSSSRVTLEEAQSARYATTGAAKFVSVDGAEGSLLFSGATLLSLTAKGAISVHTVGQDGSLLVQAGQGLTVTTKTSSDITFKAAGRYEQGSAGVTTLSSGTSLSFSSLSVDNSDFTKGDIRFFAKDSISVSAADTIEFSAQQNILLQSDTQINIQTTGDIDSESFDDTLLRFLNSFSSTSTGILTFANTPGAGGSLNFITNQPADLTFFNIGDDITWDMGANVYGYATEDITYRSSGSNGQNIAQTYSTTAVGGNMLFNSAFNTQFRADNDVFINSNGPLSVLGYLQTDFQVGGSPNTLGLSFTSSAGNIAFQSNLGAINTQAQGAYTVSATTTVSLLAAGIDRGSEAGIHVTASQGSSTFGAGNTITVQADEAITFALDHLGARFTIGASRFIDFGNLKNSLPTTSTTAFKATGHQADIVLNLRESRDGLGYIRLLAGAADPLLDFASANAVVDIFATENIRFEQESGFTWAGIYPDTFTKVTGSTSLFPSDVYFNADGDHSSIEVSTTSDALLANIDILTQSLILEADGKLTIASFGESGSSVEFKSATEGIKIQSLSTTDTDGVFLNAYNGDAAFIAVGLGEIHLEPERNLFISSTRGFNIQADSFNVQESNSNSLVQVLDGDLNLNFVDLAVSALDDVLISTYTSGDPTGSSIFFSATDITVNTGDDIEINASNLGNIYFHFANSVNMASFVDEVVFGHPSSLTIPMREADLAPGQLCSIPGELVIYRNIDFANNYDSYNTRLDMDNDSGVQLCFCMNARVWACRSLSSARPFA